LPDRQQPATPLHREALERLILRFFLNLDTLDFEALARCMAEDGVWHRQGRALTGRAAIIEALNGRSAGIRTAHIVSNLQFDLGDCGDAAGQFYVLGFRRDAERNAEAPAGTGPATIGLYRCRCVDTDEGWRIAELTAAWFQR
jgi:ketosteroid isomerase-like protein